MLSSEQQFHYFLLPDIFTAGASTQNPSPRPPSGWREKEPCDYSHNKYRNPLENPTKTLYKAEIM